VFAEKRELPKSFNKLKLLKNKKDVTLLNNVDQRDSQQVISYIENSLYDYWFALRNNKGCQYIDQPNEKWISLSYTNRVLHTSFSTDVELKLYIEKLKKTKKDWIYIISPSSRPQNQKEVILQTEGFQHRMDWAGMALELTKLKKRKMNDLLDIKKIENLEDFKTWVDLYVEGFNIDSSLKQGIYENYGKHLLNGSSPKLCVNYLGQKKSALNLCV